MHAETDDDAAACRERALQTLTRFLGDDIDADTLQELENACWKRAIQAKSAACKSVPMLMMGPAAAFHDGVIRAAYAQTCRNVIANLSSDPSVSNGNQYIRSAVVKGEIDVAKVPTMSADELAPGAGYSAPRRCRASADAVASDAFECPWCGQRKCVHYELQTRSADEATTIFVTCVACGHRWTE